jgi:hypothetical protein
MEDQLIMKKSSPPVNQTCLFISNPLPLPVAAAGFIPTKTAKPVSLPSVRRPGYPWLDPRLCLPTFRPVRLFPTQDIDCIWILDQNEHLFRPAKNTPEASSMGNDPQSNAATLPGDFPSRPCPAYISLDLTTTLFLKEAL